MDAESSDDGGDSVGEMWGLFEGWESIPEGGLVTLADHETGAPFSLALSPSFVAEELAAGRDTAAVRRGSIDVAQDMVLRRRVLASEGGRELSENESQSATGAVVWNTSVVVAAWLEANRVCARSWMSGTGSSGGAVELGAGCGVCSAMMALVLQQCGRVVATVREEMLPLLSANVRKNLALARGATSVAPLWWGDAKLTTAIAPPFDVVVATDCVYDYEIITPLLACLDDISHAHTRVVLGFDEAIGHWEVYREFWTAARNAGWRATPISLSGEVAAVAGDAASGAAAAGDPAAGDAAAAVEKWFPVPDKWRSPMVKVWLLTRVV